MLKSGVNFTNIEDVNGLVFFKFANIFAKIFLYVSIVGFIISLLVTLFDNDINLLAVTFLSVVLAIFSLLELRKNNEYFIVNYNGGTVGIRTHWFTQDELIEFQKAVLNQKDLIKKEVTPIFKECPYCAEQINAKAIVCRHCGKEI